MRLMKRFLSDARGNVMVVTGLSILLLVSVGGLGVDLGRQQMLKLELQQAADTSALAAATMEGRASDAERIALAKRYFEMNFPPEYMGVQRPTPVVTVANGEVTLKVDATVDTIFQKVLNAESSVTVGGGSTVGSGYAAYLDYDVVMVVDESGSTGALVGKQTRMDVEKAALQEMLNVIMPKEAPPAKIRFGLVGYTGNVTSHGALTNDPLKARDYIDQLQVRCQNFDHYGLNAGANMISGEWKGYRKPKQFCPQDGFTSRDDEVPIYDASYAVEENTDVDPPVSQRADGRSLSTTKHVVFLTDGFIMVEPQQVDQSLCRPGEVAEKAKRKDYSPCDGSYDIFLKACKRVKETGAILHTISFVSQTKGDVETLKKCASTDENGEPRYFYAPDAATLRTVLNNVATVIRKTRIKG